MLNRCPGLRCLLVFLYLGAAPLAVAQETPVRDLFAALGGAARLGSVETVETRVTGSNFSRDYNLVPGGPPHYLSQDDLRILWRPRDGKFRIRTALSAFHPYEGTWDYAEAFDGSIATRGGPRDYRPGGDGALAAPYVGAALRRLALGNPQLVVAAAQDLRPAGSRRIGGRPTPLLLVEAFGDIWTLAVDPATHLPVSLEIREADGMFGEIVIRADYADWRAVEGIMTPFRVVVSAADTLSRRELRTSADYDGAVTADDFRVAAEGAPADIAMERFGRQHARFFNDRAAMARTGETRPQTPVTFEEVGRDIVLIGGTGHNTLAIVGASDMVLVDAPLGPERSRDVRAALLERWPDKPVRHLILTHHHTDHSAGYALWLEAGARLVVGAPAAAYFANAALRSTGHAADILAVTGRMVLPGFDRMVELVEIPNSHAEGMLVVHVADTGVLFVTDLRSPGRPQQNPRLSAELFSALDFEGFGPLHLVGGHGRGREDWTPPDHMRPD